MASFWQRRGPSGRARLFWTEAALLALVEALAERRIDQLAAVAGGGIVNEADLGNDG